MSKVDVFILSQMVPLSTVGLYIAGYFFLDIALFIPSAFAQAIYPALSRSTTQAKWQLQTLTRRYYRLILVIGLLVVVAVTPTAAGLINLLYGEKFGPSVLVLQIVIWSIVLVSYNNTVGRAIYAAGGQWQLVLVNVCAGSSNILFNIVLIPMLGIVGSAIATPASFGVAVVLHTFYARRYNCTIDVTPLLRAIPGLAAGLFAGWVLAQWNWFAALVGAPCVLLAVLLISGYFEAAELATVNSMLGSLRVRMARVRLDES